MRRALAFLASASLLGALAHAINIAFGMTWEILWALVLGFALSAAVQAVVSKSEMTPSGAKTRSRGVVLID